MPRKLPFVHILGTINCRRNEKRRRTFVTNRGRSTIKRSTNIIKVIVIFQIKRPNKITRRSRIYYRFRKLFFDIYVASFIRYNVYLHRFRVFIIYSKRTNRTDSWTRIDVILVVAYTIWNTLSGIIFNALENISTRAAAPESVKRYDETHTADRPNVILKTFSNFPVCSLRFVGFFSYTFIT